MTKTDLVNVINAETQVSKKDTEAVINAAIAAIEGALLAGEKVQLVGFGSFEVKNRPERVGINPATRESITIPASKHLTFAAGKTLKAKLNK